MNHEWINEYIGKPFETNARGPDTYDCYGLVLAVYRDQCGIELPDWKAIDQSSFSAINAITKGVQAELAADHAVMIEEPEDFAILVLDKHGFAIHVGVYVAGGVLHTSRNTGGSCFEPLAQFKARHGGNEGWYRWHG